MFFRRLRYASISCFLPIVLPPVRPTTKPELVDVFTRLHAKGFGENGGSVECSKALMGRGYSATTGVEGFYVPSGVQIMHMFLLRPEGAIDVADMFLFCKVRFGFFFVCGVESLNVGKKIGDSCFR